MSNTQIGGEVNVGTGENIQLIDFSMNAESGGIDFADFVQNQSQKMIQQR